MGMFDTIIIDQPGFGQIDISRELPRSKDYKYQTKSLGNLMEEYIIKNDSLFKIEKTFGRVSIKERKKKWIKQFGKKSWRNPIAQIAGIYEEIDRQEVQILFHGVIRFYDEINHYAAKFTDGKLEDIIYEGTYGERITRGYN